MRRTALLLALALAACAPACPEPLATTADTSGTETTSASTEVATSSDVAAPVADTREVVLDGTPEVPPELHARLQQYLETRSASAVDISADGTQLLVTTRFANTSQLHLLTQPMGARRQLTFLEEPVADAAFVPGDAGSTIVQADVGGSENYQIYRLDRRTGRLALLTDGTHRHPELAVSRDGRVLAYVGNARNGRDMDIYLGTPTSGGQLFLERSGDWHILEIARDGSRLVLQEQISITDQRVYLVDVASRAVTRISPEGAAAERAAVLDATGTHLYVASDRMGEHVELYEVDLAHPEPSAWRPLTRDIHWNVEELALSPDGRTLAFTVNEDAASTLRLLDTRTRRISSIRGTLPRGVIGGLRFASAAPVLAFTVTSSTSTGDAYTYDLRRGNPVRWTESELGGLDPAGLVEPSLFRYPSFDGREIPCFYYRPPHASGQTPVVVWIHGGPEAQARPWFYPLIQYLVTEAGIAVLMPNVRGSDGYGKSYLALDDGRLREDSVRDIGALLDWAGRQSELDASRMAVYGGSYGGYMVLASLTHFGDRLRAGVDIVGIANFVTFLENTADYRRELRRVEYGDESDPEMRSFLADISPVTHVDRIRSALFVAHGANDPRVPASEAEQIVRAVREGGHEVWYMLARNEGHGFRRKENRDTFTELSVMFLERQLGVAP